MFTYHAYEKKKIMLNKNRPNVFFFLSFYLFPKKESARWGGGKISYSEFLHEKSLIIYGNYVGIQINYYETER